MYLKVFPPIQKSNLKTKMNKISQKELAIEENYLKNNLQYLLHFRQQLIHISFLILIPIKYLINILFIIILIKY